MAQRLDKWLVYARFVKHRNIAAALVEGGNVRVNRQRVLKVSQTVKPKDVLTIVVAGHVRVVKVLAEADRRGAAGIARLLYEELTTDAVHTGTAEKADASTGSVC